MQTVYVVTSVELGWDCIVGVFDASTTTEEELAKTFPRSAGYIIHDKTLETFNSNFWD